MPWIELEATLNPKYGAGIYVQKPELEGTRGVNYVGGPLYVNNKAELEARQREIAGLGGLPLPYYQEETKHCNT